MLLATRWAAAQMILCLSWSPFTSATGFRTVGSSGCAAQIVFTPPYTDTAVFLDNYHENYGGPGYDVSTGTHSSQSYLYKNSKISIFGTEYNLTSNTIRPLWPISNTFCSAGSFFPNGTLLNVAGAEAALGIEEGFNRLRTYNPGPCNGNCSTDWAELVEALQVKRWYPSALTMTDGNILIVGGSNVGLLVLNEASINVPTYEIVYQNGAQPKKPVYLPILDFTEAENLVPGKSYNLYPILHALPNPSAEDFVFTISGNQTIIWDYKNDKLVKTLPDTPRAARCFPSSATSVLLPLQYPNYNPTVLVCGGSSGDMPNPKALDDCWTIDPLNPNADWVENDSLPNGGQTMSDGILLPDGTVLFINGAHSGSGGGFMAEYPVSTPLIFDPSAQSGERFTRMPNTTIPRLYHSVATLLSSGEVLVSGSNPNVYYTRDGRDTNKWYPKFSNNGHTCALNQQQLKSSRYPTEYRVEIFSPPYLSSNPSGGRVQLTSVPSKITYGSSFRMSAKLAEGGKVSGAVKVTFIAPGLHTHGQAMGQRLVELGFQAIPNSYKFEVQAPQNASVMPPGIHLMFIVNNGVPSEGEWVQLG